MVDLSDHSNTSQRMRSVVPLNSPDCCEQSQTESDWLWVVRQVVLQCVVDLLDNHIDHLHTRQYNNQCVSYMDSILVRMYSDQDWPQIGKCYTIGKKTKFSLVLVKSIKRKFRLPLLRGRKLIKK